MSNKLYEIKKQNMDYNSMEKNETLSQPLQDFLSLISIV